MKRYFALLLLCLLVVPFQSSFAEVDAEKKKVIAEMMTLTKVDQLATAMGEQAANMSIASIQQRNPSADPKIYQIVREEVVGTFKEEMAKGDFLEQFYPLYDKHFTTDELKQIVAFYKTPIGQKALQEMPSLMQESMQVGQTWGQKVVPIVQQRLQARLAKEGLDKPAAESPATPAQ